MNGVGISRVVLFLGIALGGCALDLWTKDRMFAELGPPGTYASPDGDHTRWLWPKYLGLQTSLNEGALFGFGQGKVWIFAALSIVAGTAIVCWLFLAGAARDPLLALALSSVMGGVLGNLYDRLGLWWDATRFDGYPEHAVRDWILMRYGDWVWPNYNVADMMLVGGAGLLLLHAWRTPAAKENPEATRSIRGA